MTRKTCKYTIMFTILAIVAAEIIDDRFEVVHVFDDFQFVYCTLLFADIIMRCWANQNYTQSHLT